MGEAKCFSFFMAIIPHRQNTQVSRSDGSDDDKREHPFGISFTAKI
jgi:hypothetical protein